jgi:16S rRNA (adenine1518-N6/adenine1519-N6)-dimethyltransferase
LTGVKQSPGSKSQMNSPKGESAKVILERYGLTPKKSLGQNFLSDNRVLAQIAACGTLTRKDTVLEIGPGVGSLTHHLADLAGKVIAVELDDRLIPILQERLSGYENVRIIHGDILLMDPGHLFEQSYKVVSNIPYYITGAILRHLLSTYPRPSRITMTIQAEVADRLTASPGDMSILSVTTQYFGKIKREFTVKAGSFWPSPEVDSKVVSLILNKELPLSQGEEEALFQLVKVGFSHKRKQLRKNLRAIIPSKQEIERVFLATGIDGTRRAETLSVAEWLRLYWAINTQEN